MNDDLSQAAREAVEASDNTRQVELITAVLRAQQLLNSQQQHTCQHHHAPVKQEFNAKKWLVIGVVVAGVGLVGALFAIAIAIAVCCATCSLVILRSIWREHQKNR